MDRYTKLDGKRVLIWGYGREGKSSERFLREYCKPAEIAVFEGKREDIDESKYDCILEYSTKDVQRFGSVSQVVDRAYLLPRSEFNDFICACLSRPWGGAGLSAKTQRGAGWMYFYPDKQVRQDRRRPDRRVRRRVCRQ